jgi:hypothetical protein
MPPKKDGKK